MCIKLLVVSVLTLVTLAMAGCSNDGFVGWVPEEVQSPLEAVSEVEINNFGNLFVITANGNSYDVIVDSVKATDSVVDLNDSTYLKFYQIDFSRFNGRVNVNGSEVVERRGDYQVKNLDCQLNLYRDDLSIPIRFKRQVVSVIANGMEYKSDYSFQIKLIKWSYYDSVPLVTDEDSYSRTYFDLDIEVLDGDYSLGTIKTRVSFYAAHAPIVFDAGAYDWKEV